MHPPRSGAFVDTQGSDIANLMMALGQLCKPYTLHTLQYWAIIISIIFFVLALIVVVWDFGRRWKLAVKLCLNSDSPGLFLGC